MHIICIGLKCDSTATSECFLVLCTRRKEDAGVWVLRLGWKLVQVLSFHTQLGILGISIAQVFFGAVLLKGIVGVFPSRDAWDELFCKAWDTGILQKQIQSRSFLNPVLRQSLMKPQVCMSWLYEPELGAGWWDLLLQEWKGVRASWAALGVIPHKWGLAKASRVVNLCIM